MNNRSKAYIYLFIATFIWGAAAPIIKFTFQGVDPFPFLTYRFLIAGIFGILVILSGQTKIPKTKTLLVLSFIYGALATTLALSALFIGLKSSNLLDLILIGNSAPLLIMLGGWLFFKEKITNREKKGTIITLFGTALVVLSPIIFGGSTLRLTGNLFLLLFLIFDTSSTLLSKYMEKHKVDPIFLTNFAFVVSIFTLLPFTIYFYGAQDLYVTFINLEFKYLFGIFYMAIFSGNIAYAAFVKGIRLIEVSEAGLFAYLQPLISTPLAVLWLGETITLSFIIGAIIIASGVYIAETKR